MSDQEKEYSYEEKLFLVAQELMDPKEIGLTDHQEARDILSPKEPVLGQYVQFEASEVPLELRMKWAQDETKIKESFDRDKWLADNKDTHVIQAHLRCGNMHGVFSQAFTEVVPGFIDMLKTATNHLEQLYAKQKSKQEEIKDSPSKAAETEGQAVLHS